MGRAMISQAVLIHLNNNKELEKYNFEVPILGKFLFNKLLNLS